MDKIIDRIRKLLALAHNNTSAGEREAALAKAHALLLQHNLNEADIRGSDIVREDDVNLETMEFAHFNAWSRGICNGIAQLYFCRFVSCKTDKGRLKMMMIGTKADATVALHVCTMVLNSVWRESQAFARANKHSGYTNSRLRTDFVNNAGITIYWRCMKMIEDAKKGATTESAGRELMVINVYDKKKAAADAWVDANMKLDSRKTGGRVSLRDSGAARAGREHAAKVQLTMSVAAE